MITIDANLLIYAYHAAAPEHDRARRWLQRTFTGGEPVRLAWSTVHAFLRIVTHPRAFTRPYAIREARAIVEEWFDQRAVAPFEPGERYWPIFASLLIRGQARGNLVMDAHLAALAIEHGAVLYTSDKDFSRFEGLEIVNPLA